MRGPALATWALTFLAAGLLSACTCGEEPAVDPGGVPPTPAGTDPNQPGDAGDLGADAPVAALQENGGAEQPKEEAPHLIEGMVPPPPGVKWEPWKDPKFPYSREYPTIYVDHGLPVHPNAEMIVARSGRDMNDGATLVLLVPGTVADAAEYYKSELESRGYETSERLTPDHYSGIFRHQRLGSVKVMCKPEPDENSARCHVRASSQY